MEPGSRPESGNNMARTPSTAPLTGGPASSRPSASGSFATKADLQDHYVAQAKLFSTRQYGTIKDMSWRATCKELGGTYGVGYGLYFRELRWLQYGFLMLAILSVPFWIVINTSVFTDEAHKDQHEFGVTQFSSLQVYSFTFAAILDGSHDNNTLTWLNTRLANTWMGPELKRTFLIWIAVVDAVGVLLFALLTVGMMFWAKSFVEKVDKRTLEVSDFTVLVRGLPADATAWEIGDYFSRFGKVMDVVLVKNMSPLLNLCAEASLLEERRRLMADQMQLYNSVLYGKRAEEVEKHLGDTLNKMDTKMGSQPFKTKAVFVTFDHEHEARICMHNCPAGAFSSLFQPASDLFRRRNRFWVSQAQPPEDYKFENLACSLWNLFTRRLLCRGLLALVLILCALALTKLSTLGGQQARTLTWYTDSMMVDITEANPGLAATAAAAYCQASLSSSCSAGVSDIYNATIGLAWGQLISWPTVDAQLLAERSLVSILEASTRLVTGSNSTALGAAASGGASALGACLPCYCLGLSQSAEVSDPTAAWAATASSQCHQYINGFNIHTWGIRIGISLVMASLNYFLKFLLGFLVVMERHSTMSSQEQAYAVLSYVYRFINSAVVLLLVNAAPLHYATDSSAQTVKWLRHFIMNGQYSDFTPEWYQNVGLSIMVLLVINVFMPLVSVVADKAGKVFQRCCLLNCKENSGQHRYNEAFARPQFTLEERVSDIMFNVSLALMFGSGMPLCYLIVLVACLVQEVVDRAALTHIYCAAVRYGKALPMLVIRLLPWVIMMHCAFGVWAHTYFLVQNNTTGANGVSNSMAAGSRTWHRITQPNGLPLLACAIATFAFLIVGRYTVWKLLAALSRSCQCQSLMWYFAEDPTTSVTYGQALTSFPRMLKGVPTYRLPHHPRYHLAFVGSLYRAIWMHAVGTERFTYVVTSRGQDGMDVFEVTAACQQTADMSDLEEAAASMPDTLSEVVKRMSSTAASISRSRASSGVVPSGQSRGRSMLSARSSGTVAASSAAASRGPSQVVNIMVLAEGDVVPPTSQLFARFARPSGSAMRAPTQQEIEGPGAGNYSALNLESAPRPPVAIGHLGQTVTVPSARQMVAGHAITAAGGTPPSALRGGNGMARFAASIAAGSLSAPGTPYVTASLAGQSSAERMSAGRLSAGPSTSGRSTPPPAAGGEGSGCAYRPTSLSCVARPGTAPATPSDPRDVLLHAPLLALRTADRPPPPRGSRGSSMADKLAAAMHQEGGGSPSHNRGDSIL